MISTGKKGWKYFKIFSHPAYRIDDGIKKNPYLVFLMYLEVFHLVLDNVVCKNVLLILYYIYKVLLSSQSRDEKMVFEDRGLLNASQSAIKMNVWDQKTWTFEGRWQLTSLKGLTI